MLICVEFCTILDPGGRDQIRRIHFLKFSFNSSFAVVRFCMCVVEGKRFQYTVFCFFNKNFIVLLFFIIFHFSS